MKQFLMKQKTIIMSLLFILVTIIIVTLLFQFNKKETKVESYPNATFCLNLINDEEE